MLSYKSVVPRHQTIHGGMKLIKFLYITMITLIARVIPLARYVEKTHS